MIKIKLDFDLDEIVKNVSLQTYYVGEARKTNLQNSDLASKLQLSDDESFIILDLLHEGIVKLCNRLNTMCGDALIVSGEDYKIGIELQVQNNFMELDALKGIANEYLETSIIEKWYELMKPDEAATPIAKLTELESDLRQIMSHRSKPTIM